MVIKFGGVYIDNECLNGYGLMFYCVCYFVFLIWRIIRNYCDCELLEIGILECCRNEDK